MRISKAVWSNVILPIVGGIVVNNLGFVGCGFGLGIYTPAPCWLINFIIGAVVTAAILDFFIYFFYPKIIKKDRKQQKNKVPTLRIRDFGNAPKTLGHDVWDTDFVEKRITLSREITGEFDTLFIEVFNKQSEVGAEKVWSWVEWMNDKNEVLLPHHGRWHIPTETMKNEKVKENLQYRDLDSNQSTQTLYFAWAYADHRDKFIYGLERDLDGRDSWGTTKYQLKGKQYIVRITLQGNNGVKQEFKYRVKNRNGKISVAEALTDESKKIQL